MIDPIISIIVIGDEILCGKTADSNSHFISQTLHSKGFDVRYISIVGDTETDVIDAVNKHTRDSHVLIITGGLGPTPDDMTRFAISKAINEELRVFPQEVKRIHSRLTKSSARVKKISEIEAHLPVSAKPIRNAIGLAPGFHVNYCACDIFCIPGVPQEAESMLLGTILPYIELHHQPAKKSHYLLKTIGIGESELYRRIKPFLKPVIQVGLYPKGREVELRLHAATRHKKQLDSTYKKAKKILSEYIYAETEIGVVEAVGHLLAKGKLTLATAESCTGGLIAKRITDVPGSSAYFVGSFITYSNKLKTALLGVKEETLLKYGAVSPQVVRQMTKGLSSSLGADMSVSVSGIAGPSGGSKEKQVGLVCIGIDYNGKSAVKKYHFRGDRKKVRWLASQAAFHLMWSALR